MNKVAFPDMALKEAKPFLIIALIVTVAGFWIHPAAGAVGLLIFFSILAFFRDPRRRPPEDPDAIVSAADGKVVSVSEIDDPHYQHGPMLRIAVFLSVLDVHVNRSPVDASLLDIHHHAGDFLDARDPNVELKNEAMNWNLETPRGPVVVRQIAGLIARRIVAWKKPGTTLKKGERIGMIRFGSRTDVLLPPGCQPEVEVGQRVRGGETIIARWPSSPSTPTTRDETSN
jgi:phosphatidylserine decarboxylase